MSRPDVLIEETNGNLGRTADSQDGTTAMVVTGVAVADQFALGDVVGPFFSKEDAEAIGIDAAYDEANSVLAYEHVRAFFDAAGNGTKLYLMVAENTVLMSALADKDQNYLAKICREKKDVKIGIITRIPDGAYEPTYEGQIEEDILLAATNAKELIDFEKAAPQHRELTVVLEGRNFQGDASLSQDLRALDKDGVSVVIGADNDVSTRDVGGQTPYIKYAFAGYFGGIRAGIPVQQNAGRVKSGSLNIDNAGLSNGAAMETFTDQQQSKLNGFGYIFAWEIAGKAGWYICDDHNCVLLTSDYAYMPNRRVANKVRRITRAVYVEELLDDVEIDPTTGGLAVSVMKAFQERLEKVLNRDMVNRTPKEASRITVYINPEQNVLATDKIEAETSIVPKGTARTIVVKQSFENPFNQ